MRRLKNSATELRNRGFTLVEVLVAALVLSIGLLGLAGLQATSQKLGQDSQLYSAAVSLAYSMADSLRANAEEALTTSNYDLSEANKVDCDEAFSPPTGTTAAIDKAEWNNLIACTLPLGYGTVSVNAGTSLATVEIHWDETRTLANEDAEADRESVFSLRVQL